MATGPAPKVERHRKRGQALAQSATGIRLPRDGRRGKLPRWPFADQSAHEKATWRRLWRTPASVAWEQLGWHDIVARYARVLSEAEGSSVMEEVDWHVANARDRAIGVARAEARQLEDRLGLTPMAMARLRWVIVDEEPEDEKESAPDVRQRLRAV